MLFLSYGIGDFFHLLIDEIIKNEASVGNLNIQVGI